jgi:4-hydroxybenzoate polyprenyltransferase
MAVKNYLGLIKFSHTVFALPFAMIGFCLGVNEFSAEVVVVQFSGFSMRSDELLLLKLLLLVVGCMIFARSAAMAFNRWLDARYDAQNPRTATREIPAGIIPSKHALSFVIACGILFIACTFFINKICFYLSPVALFVILFYSYTKRFTAWCHLVLGVGLSLAPIGAYLAVVGQFAWLPLFFSFAVICWVSGFDIIYALQDEQFDKQHDLRSIPVAFGKSKALLFSRLLHFLSACFIVSAGMYGDMGKWYWIGCVFFVALLVYQHLLVKPNDLSKVNIAFFTTNGIASIVFSSFVIFDLISK